MKYLYVFPAATVTRGVFGCIVVWMYSGVSVSPGYAGHKRDDAPDDLWLRTADAALTIG